MLDKFRRPTPVQSRVDKVSDKDPELARARAFKMSKLQRFANGPESIQYANLSREMANWSGAHPASPIEIAMMDELEHCVKI